MFGKNLKNLHMDKGGGGRGVGGGCAFYVKVGKNNKTRTFQVLPSLYNILEVTEMGGGGGCIDSVQLFHFLMSEVSLIYGT